MIKSIIFDFDGVLVESVEVKANAFAEIFKPYGRQTVDRVVAYHLANGGVSRFEKFTYFYSQILRKPLSESEMSRLADHFAELVIDKVVAAPFVCGAKAFLDRYAEKIDLHIVSGAPETELLEIVNKRGMSRYFKSIHGSPGLKIATTQLIAKACDPRGVVFVGDAMIDLRAAEACGIRFVGRANPCEAGGGTFAGLAVPVIQDLSELAGVIGLKK